MRPLVCTLTLMLLSACALGPAARASHTAPPATARSVVLQPQDMPAIQKCPQSDRWAGLMLTGQPQMLPTGFSTWSHLEAAGATEGWLSLYADDISECPLLLGSAAPKGRLVYTVAIKFKDTPMAAASYASDSLAFPVADSFFARFVAAGGKLVKGARTGFGDNSAVATISFRGVPTYVVLWQNKEFEAIVWGDNVSASEAGSAVGRMNGRID